MVQNISEVRPADAITIISVICSTIGVGGIISGAISRRLTRSEQEAAEKEKTRQKETVLMLKGIKAAGDLSLATAVALKRGYANGEVEKGIESFEAFDKEFEQFLIEQSARK